MEDVKIDNVDRFIQLVIQRKREVLGRDGLKGMDLHYFLAGMNTAMFALRKTEADDGK